MTSAAMAKITKNTAKKILVALNTFPSAVTMAVTVAGNGGGAERFLRNQISSTPQVSSARMDNAVRGVDDWIM